MKRRPTTQDITWLLDLSRNQQLDLSPPYQRRSVWTTKDKQFFLDTIFRDFPSPAIFLHKSISGEGKSMYHVVDGKQRLETILAFAANKLRISPEFGDIRLSGKKWSDLEGEQEIRHRFWNYQMSVEMVDIVEGTIVNEVFDRLNRNSRKLTRQELRHAKYDGWLITTVEAEADKPAWSTLGVVTTARSKRMADTQFLSELLMIVIKKAVLGFSQDTLDDFYAEYDDTEEATELSVADFDRVLEASKIYLLAMEATNEAVTLHAGGVGSFYTLWSAVVMNLAALPTAGVAAERFTAFMSTIERWPQHIAEQAEAGRPVDAQSREALYYENSRGASTDLKPRQERHRLMTEVLLGQ